MVRANAQCFTTANCTQVTFLALVSGVALFPPATCITIFRSKISTPAQLVSFCTRKHALHFSVSVLSSDKALWWNSLYIYPNPLHPQSPDIILPFFQSLWFTVNDSSYFRWRIVHLVAKSMEALQHVTSGTSSRTTALTSYHASGIGFPPVLPHSEYASMLAPSCWPFL